MIVMSVMANISTATMTSTTASSTRRTLSTSVVDSHIHHSIANTRMNQTVVSIVRSFDTLVEKTMTAATMTRS